MKRILHLLLLLCLSLSASGQSLKGHITLSDTLPGKYATVQIPALQMTVVANEYGDYRFRSLPPGTYEMEFSHINYGKAKSTVQISENATAQLDMNLEMQPYDLPMAYALPNGQDPAAYILKKMWDRTATIRKTLNYNATLSYDFSTYNLDIIGTVMPPFAIRLMKMMFNMMGYKPIVNFAFFHNEPMVTVEMQKKCAGKKVTDSNQRIVECNISLNESERQFFFKNKFIKKNVYDEISSTIAPWGKDGSLKKYFKYEGSYMEDGQYIDVLTARKKNTICTIHVAEDDWQIVKTNCYSDEERTSILCQKIHGVYLPVSYSQRMSMNLFNEKDMDYFYHIAQQIKDGATSYTTPDGEQKTVTASMRKSMEKLWPKLQQNRSKKELLPICVSYNCGIRYE